MRGESANRALMHQGTQDGLGSGAAIVRVGSAEELVDEEECWSVVAGGEDGVKPPDFGEELGLALGEGVGEGE